MKEYLSYVKLKKVTYEILKTRFRNWDDVVQQTFGSFLPYLLR